MLVGGLLREVSQLLLVLLEEDAKTKTKTEEHGDAKIEKRKHKTEVGVKSENEKQTVRQTDTYTHKTASPAFSMSGSQCCQSPHIC